MKHRPLLFFLAVMAFSSAAAVEDGYDLWLRCRAVAVAACPELATGVRAERAPMRGLSGLAGTTIPLVGAVNRDGAVSYGTPESSQVIAAGRDAGVLYGAFQFPQVAAYLASARALPGAEFSVYARGAADVKGNSCAARC